MTERLLWVLAVGVATLVVLGAASQLIGCVTKDSKVLERLPYYADTIGRYRLWVRVQDGPWNEVRGYSETIGLELGETQHPLRAVSAFAVMYPSGVLVDVVPDGVRPPPGSRFLTDVRPPDQHILRLVDLRSGEGAVDVSFGQAGARPQEAGHYSTSLTNRSSLRVRIRRFAGYSAASGGTFVLNTITGGFFTESHSREWYPVTDPAVRWSSAPA